MLFKELPLSNKKSTPNYCHHHRACVGMKPTGGPYERPSNHLGYHRNQQQYGDFSLHESFLLI